MHGQHEHQALLDPQTHLPLLDDHARLDELVQKTGERWSEVRRLRDQLERSTMDARERAARLDLIAFQLGEIEKVSPTPGEDEALASTRHVLASAERVQRLCEESYASLYESDAAVLTGLSGVWKRVGELATIDPQFSTYIDGRDTIKSQLEDLAFFLRGYADRVDASPKHLEQVEERLAAIERLKRKYGPSLGDVLDTRDRLASERDLLGGRRRPGRGFCTDCCRPQLTRFWRPRGNCRASAGQSPRYSPAPPSRSSPSWPWRARGSTSASTTGSCRQIGGANAGSTQRNSSSRQTLEKTCARSRGSCPAANCHGSQSVFFVMFAAWLIFYIAVTFDLSKNSTLRKHIKRNREFA